MLSRFLALSMLLFCFLRSSSADDLDDVWQAWKTREIQYGNIEMEYTSHVVRTMEDKRVPPALNRRSTAQGTTTAHFASGGSMLTKTLLKETNTSESKLGQGTTIELAYDDLSLLYYKGRTAFLSKRTDGRMRINEVGLLYHAMYPASSATKDAYSKEPEAEIDGKLSLVVSRSFVHSNQTTKVTLYLSKNHEFAPIRMVCETRQGDQILSTMNATFAYEQLDGVYVPKVWVIDELQFLDRPPALTQRTSALRESVKLNAELPPSVFRVDIPPGTEIRDSRGVTPSKEVLVQTKTFGATDAK